MLLFTLSNLSQNWMRLRTCFAQKSCIMLEIYRVRWIIRPTLLTSSATKAIKTGALKRVRDQGAEPSIQTWIDLTSICDPCQRAEKSEVQNFFMMKILKYLQMKLLNSPSDWVLLGAQMPYCLSRSKLCVSEHLKQGQRHMWHVACIITELTLTKMHRVICFNGKCRWTRDVGSCMLVLILLQLTNIRPCCLLSIMTRKL